MILISITKYIGMGRYRIIRRLMPMVPGVWPCSISILLKLDVLNRANVIHNRCLPNDIPFSSIVILQDNVTI